MLNSCPMGQMCLERQSEARRGHYLVGWGRQSFTEKRAPALTLRERAGESLDGEHVLGRSTLDNSTEPS